MTASNLTKGCTLHRKLDRLIGVAADNVWHLARSIGPDDIDVAALALDLAESEARSLELLARRRRRAAKRLKHRIEKLKGFEAWHNGHRTAA